MIRESQGLAVLFKRALMVGVVLAALPVSNQVEAKRDPSSANVRPRQPVDARGNGKHEGQLNDRCETDQDCRDRSPPLTCQAAADQKVCRIKPGTILPPT